MSRAFMIRGQHTGFHHWRVFPDPPTKEMMEDALAFELEREGVRYLKDEKGQIVNAQKNPCWVMAQIVELMDGKPDDDQEYVPLRLTGEVSDEELEEKLQLALNPATFQNAGVIPQVHMQGAAETDSPTESG